MKVFSAEISSNWSWSFVMDELVKLLPYDFCRFSDFNNNQKILTKEKSTPVLAQNIPSIQYIPYSERVISRMGSMRSLKGNIDGIKSVFAVIATNNELYKIGKDLNPNTHLIPNGVDLDKFKSAKNKHPFIVGFSGNIRGVVSRDYKGFDLLEEAIKGIPLKLALCSDYQISHDDMPEFFSKISCLILPSKGEGCNNTVMEALACAIPVIITKTGYHGDMLEDKKNCLFIERDVDSIKKAVYFLKENNQKRIAIGEAGRRFAEKHHDIKNIAKLYDKIIQDLIRENQRKYKEEQQIVIAEALFPIFDEELGRIERGMCFKVNLRRAKGLGGLVQIKGG